jgi:hypothetical protein
MKRLLVILLVVGFLAGCAGTLEKGCKELTKISNDITAYMPNAVQLVDEGKMSEADLNSLLEYVDYIEKAKVSACALKEVWED